MAVPLLDLKAQNHPLECELVAAFTRVLRSGQFILGAEVESFEQRVAELIGVRHAIGVSSATDAILLALMALDIKAGDEVICPTFTFFATAGCIALPHYHEYTQNRKANASYYTDNLRKIPGVRMASAAQSKCPPANAKHTQSERSEAALAEPEAKLILPSAYAWNDPIGNQYTLRVPGEGRRDALKSFLAERGIGTEIYYPVPMHLHECFSRLGSGSEFLPCATRLAKECLSIPIFPELSRIQMDAVIGALQQFLLQAPARA